MKQAWLIVIVLLLLSLVVNWIQYRSAELAQMDRNLEAEVFRIKANDMLGHIHHRDSAIAVLFNDRREDSTRQAKKERVLISRISALKSKVATSSNRLPDTKDSIILVQDTLIMMVTDDRDSLYKQDNTIIDSLRRQVFDYSELLKGQFRQNAVMGQELERIKKKRFVVGPAIGIDYRGNPSISFGVSYQLWKF